MIKVNDVKKLMEEIGYYATEELVNDSYNALVLFESAEIDQGQDIYAVCLEGPPGAGKTEYAITFSKMSEKLFGNVELVDYQCNITTGKSELYEDINVTAAVGNDMEHVNIPGKLIIAINKVNAGKKVVLFIDEYDKAREETDGFLLQFLQSGKINTNQHGDLAIKDEYKGNLQVILCKNDMREELSGPLYRRLRIIRLEPMRPDIFYKVANRKIIDNAQNAADKKALTSLVNLVSLMYEKAYNQKDMYTRIPSCSEMLLAIQDANRLSKGGVELSYVYKSILKNMFKSLDDMNTFESIVGNGRNSDELTKFLKTVKEAKHDEEGIEQLDKLIAENVLVDLSKELVEQKEKFAKMVADYKTKFEKMEIDRQTAIDSELAQIRLANGGFTQFNQDDAIGNFHDETLYLKRGKKVCDISQDEWCEVTWYTYPTLDYEKFVQHAIEYAYEFGITVYEDGFKIGEKYGKSLIVYPTKYVDNSVKDPTMREGIKLSFYVDSPIVPCSLLKDIWSFIELIEKDYLDPGRPRAFNNDTNVLVYNEKENAYNHEYKSIKEDNRVYNVCGFEHFPGNGPRGDVILHTYSIGTDSEDGFNDALKKIKQSRKRVAQNE